MQECCLCESVEEHSHVLMFSQVSSTLGPREDELFSLSGHMNGMVCNLDFILDLKIIHSVTDILGQF